jgi:putative phage-type endonuclease
MKIITIQQNSKEWVDWRGRGLGASDAPVIMEVSPWTSPFELWTYKTGLCRPPEANPFAVAAMKRGHDLEPLARAIFESDIQRLYPSVSAEHSEFPYIRASFDGYNADTNTILEIKCPGKADHKTAMNGTIPKKYYPQLQQQFLVSGAKMGYYASWDGISPNLEGIIVYPNEEYIEELKSALQAFWSRVQMKLPPAATKADLNKLTDRLSADMLRLKNSINALECLASNIE